MQNFNDLLHILNDLKNEGNLEGVIYAYRDGGLIVENVGILLNSNNFLSMCASVLESAVGIGETIGNQKINKVIAELAEKTILIFECDTKTFLILIINSESKISNTLSKLNIITEKIVKMY